MDGCRRDTHFQKQVIIKTKADSIREFIKSESGTLHVIFEEGTQSTWLYELIKPLVAEVAVCDVRKHKTGHKGNHADAIDAEQLANLLRLGSVKSVPRSRVINRARDNQEAA